MKTYRGFTLIEMMVVLAILAILSALAAPSFSATITRTKVRKTTDFIAQMINTARAEALNKNTDVYLSLSNGTVCLSRTIATCDSTNVNFIRADPFIAGTTVDFNTDTSIVFSGSFGTPNKAYTINIKSSSDATVWKAVNLNIVGLYKITGS